MTAAVTLTVEQVRALPALTEGLGGQAGVRIEQEGERRAAYIDIGGFFHGKRWKMNRRGEAKCLDLEPVDE